MSWLTRLLRPKVEKDHKDVQKSAKVAIDDANDAVTASKKARKSILDLELELRRRS